MFPLFVLPWSSLSPSAKKECPLCATSAPAGRQAAGDSVESSLELVGWLETLFWGTGCVSMVMAPRSLPAAPAFGAALPAAPAPVAAACTLLPRRPPTPCTGRATPWQAALNCPRKNKNCLAMESLLKAGALLWAPKPSPHAQALLAPRPRLEEGFAAPWSWPAAARPRCWPKCHTWLHFGQGDKTITFFFFLQVMETISKMGRMQVNNLLSEMGMKGQNDSIGGLGSSPCMLLPQLARNDPQA